MKKYGMLVLSLIIILSTISIYIYENTGLPVLSFKEPEINFKSNKFGNIRNIVWGKAGNYSDHLFILADNAPNSKENISYIYYLNIYTEKYGILTSFETNENFKNYMEYLQWETLYVISQQGLNSIKPTINSTTGDVYCDNTLYPIPDLKNVDSISIGNQIHYTKSTDKLLYNQDMPGGVFFFSNLNSQGSTRTLYANVYKVLPSPDWSNIYFTKRERNGVNAYELENRNGSGGIRQNLIAKNFIYTRISPFLGGGLLVLTDEGSEFGILYEGNKIGKIDKNTDLQGQIPDMQLKAINNTSEVYYSSFNNNHIGSIYSLGQYSNEGMEIVKNQPIIGPIRLSMSIIDPKLLFFTYENNRVHVKTCNTDGNELMDITELLK